MNKFDSKMIEEIEDELYRTDTGHVSHIVVMPGGKMDGLEYGPVTVDIVVLDSDGKTIAYRGSTDAQDDDWQIGTVEDAVSEAASIFDAMNEAA